MHSHHKVLENVNGTIFDFVKVKQKTALNLNKHLLVDTLTFGMEVEDCTSLSLLHLKD